MTACRWDGDDDAETVHLGAFSGDQLVGIASVLRLPLPRPVEGGRYPTPAYRLRGMATHPDHRGQGHATAVLAECIARVRAAGGVALWCNARTSAAGFYRQHGWKQLGNQFDLPDIGPHVVMWLDIAH